MTYNEFSELLGGGWYDKVTAKCQCDNCDKIEVLQKGSALNNFVRNSNLFKCRPCSYTEEGKKKISATSSYKRSDETRKKMSDAKKAFFQTEEGVAHRQQLAHNAATNFKSLKNSRRNGYYLSTKTGAPMYYDSSYELKAMTLLDANPEVLTYQCQVHFTVENRERRLDLLVFYKNDSIDVIEVKAASNMNDAAIKQQIEDNKVYAAERKFGFKLWVEADLGYTHEHEITAWADGFIGKMQGVDYIGIRKQKNTEKSKLFRQRHDDELHISFYCEFCKEEHRRLKREYDNNVELNGRFICLKENGQIIGRQPKKKKENPYAAEGKKECRKCGAILVLTSDNFNLDKSRSDGYNSKCSKCNREDCKNRYERKKHEK